MEVEIVPVRANILPDYVSPLTGTETVLLISNGILYKATAADIAALVPLGPPGPVGPGVPVGGAENQILTKVSGSDFATQWQSLTAQVLSTSLNLSKVVQADLGSGNIALNNVLDAYTGESFNFVTYSGDRFADGVIIINIGGTKYIRQFTGFVNVKWFGAKGDGVTNDSIAVQKAIYTFSGVGATILFPEGRFPIKDVQVPKGISIVSLQLARDNFLSDVQSKIIPVAGATYVFEYEDDAKNCLMDGLFIDGDYATFPDLVAGVRWAGTFNKMINCNITRCAQYAVKSTCGAFVLQDCNIQGWYGTVTPDIFDGINDFKGAFDAELMGDSYLLNSEIGAGLPYFTSTVTPRDPVNGRIVALHIGKIFGGTSVISGNLLENGDRAAAIGNCLYCRFDKNRYELSAMGGLYIYGPMQFVNFDKESFADNSLSSDGAFDDITIATGAAGNIIFNSPIFESLVNGAIPNSNFKVRYHISNYGSTLIDIATPIVDPIYSVNGLINLTDAGTLPLRQVLVQYDPNNPIWPTVSTKAAVIDTPRGYVRLNKGTSVADGNLLGALEFYSANDVVPKAIIGFNAGNDLWFLAQNAGATFIFIGGKMHITKPGGNSFKVISTDLAGAVEMGLEAGPASDFVFNVSMDPDTGETTVVGNGDIVLGLSDNIKISPTGETYFPAPLDEVSASGTVLMALDITTKQLVAIDPTSFAPSPVAPKIIDGSVSGGEIAHTGSANPIVIDNWQTTPGLLALGNRPEVEVFQKLLDDGDGNFAESERSDIRPFRYYTDGPITNYTLNKIVIDTGDGATLSTDYVIKIKS